jgi:hypothetical protein
MIREEVRCRHGKEFSRPDNVFGLRYQSPPFDNVLLVRLTRGGSF